MNIKLNPLAVVLLFFFCSIKPVLATTSTSIFFQILLNFYTTTSLDDQIMVMDEICDNGLDDDNDGLYDAFDDDCQCNLPNLVVNGDFEIYEEGCCTRSVHGEDICVDNWTHTFSTPDFIHPNCIGLAINGEANYYDVPLDNTFFGVIISHANLVDLPQLNGMRSETIGQCLQEPLIAGERYILSVDVGVKGNLDGTPADLTQDIFFTINGIPDCGRLDEYRPEIDFCDKGLPFQQLSSVNLFGLNRGWNRHTFEFTPATNLSAIFVMGDCDLEVQEINMAVALFDNVKIQKKRTPRIENQIIVEGNPCDENNMLRFSVEQVQGATYQWYLDSVPQPRRITASLTFGLNADIVGTHHVYVTFPDGHCELIGPYDFAYEAPSSRDTITICPGSTILVGGNIVSLAGEFTDTFPSIINGCDSTATLDILIEEVNNTYITDTIVEGQSYDFNGTAIRTTGMYRDTLLTMRGCDSILILDLMVNLPRGEICDNNIDDDRDGLVDVFDPDCQCQVDANLSVDIGINGPNCYSNTELFVTVVTIANYQWYKDSVLLEGETNSELVLAASTVDIGGIYQVSIIKNDGNCELLSVEVVEPTNYSFEIYATICEGETYTLGDSTYNLAGSYTQTISRRDIDCDSTTNLNLEVLATIIGDTIDITQNLGTSYTFQGFTYDESGIYQANLTSVASCDSLVWLNLNLIDPCANLFEVTAEWSDADCEAVENGQIVLQTINGVAPFQYSIDGGNNFSEQTIFNNLPTGAYDIVAMDGNNCVSTNAVSIAANTSTLFFKLSADTFLYEGQSINLSIVESNFDPTSYNWNSDVALIDCPNCPTIRINPVESGEYTLTATNENGCQATDAIVVEIKPIPQLYIPSAFSPNGDGNNDVFKIEGLPEVIEQVTTMKVFDRWGNLVYQQQKTTNRTSCEWDGAINNQVAISGVYMYVISWQNQWGKQELLTGDFTLMR